jgi:hypothetical protein
VNLQKPKMKIHKVDFDKIEKASAPFNVTCTVTRYYDSPCIKCVAPVDNNPLFEDDNLFTSLIKKQEDAVGKDCVSEVFVEQTGIEWYIFFRRDIAVEVINVDASQYMQSIGINPPQSGV